MPTNDKENCLTSNFKSFLTIGNDMSASTKEIIRNFSDTVKIDIDLPNAPIMISNEPKNLLNSDIEIHCTNGNIYYGQLISLDQTKHLLHYKSIPDLGDI
jgi:hypothetical protein